MTTARSGNDILLDLARPFEERLAEATQLWVQNSRRATGLLTDKPLFAARCWATDKKSRKEPIEQDTTYLIQASSGFVGGDAWDSLLLDRGACYSCYEIYRFENLQLCTGCMKFLCYRCGEKHHCTTGSPVG